MTQVSTGRVLPSDAVSQQYVPDESAKLQAAWEAEHRVSFAQNVRNAYADSPVAHWARSLVGDEYPNDPDFNLDQKTLDTLADGIDVDLRPVFAQARSRQHADYLRLNALSTMERRQQYQASGMSGYAASVVAGVYDPVGLTVGVLSGGISHIAFGVRATRLARMAQAGLVNAVPIVAAESYKRYEQPGITNTDLFSAGLGAFGMGAAGELAAGMGGVGRALTVGVGSAVPQAAFEAARGQQDADDIAVNAVSMFLLGAATSTIGKSHLTPEQYKALENVIKDVQYRDMVDSGATPTAKGEAFFKDQIDPKVRTATLMEQYGVQAFDGVDKVIATVQNEVAFRAAADKLKAMSPDRRLNRQEVADVLEGTGYSPANQGWPTAAELGDSLLMLKGQALQDKLTTSPVDAPVATAVSSESRGTDVPPQEVADVEKAIAALATQSQLQPPREAMGTMSPNDPSLVSNPPRKPMGKGGKGLDLSDVTDAPMSLTHIGPLRISWEAGQWPGTSDISAFRLNANMMAPDALLKQGGVPANMSSVQWKHALRGAFEAESTRKWDELYGGYRKTMLAIGNDAMDYVSWRNEVTKAVRNPDPHPDMSIQAAAQAAAKYFRTLLEVAQEHGVKGADLIDPNDMYASRIVNRGQLELKIAWLNSVLGVSRLGGSGEEYILGFLTRAIRSGNRAIKPDTAAKVAEVLRKNWGTVHDGSDVSRSRINELDQRELFIEKMREVGATEEQIADAVFDIQKSKLRKDKNGNPVEGTDNSVRFKHRTMLDEKFSEDIVGPDGNNYGTLSIEDFFENDIAAIMRIASDQVYGAAAISEVYRRNSVDGQPLIDTRGKYEAHLKKQARDAGKISTKGEILPKTQHEIDTLMYLHDVTAGLPLRETTNYTKAANILNNSLLARLLAAPGMGIRNALEISESIAEKGLNATFAAMPDLPALVNDIRLGKVDDNLFQSIESFGFGVNTINGRHIRNATIEDGTRVGLSNAEVMTARAARLSAKIGLTESGQQAISKINADINYRYWAEMAKTGKMPTLKRAKQSGFSSVEEMKAVLDEMKKPGNFFVEDGVHGKYKVIRPDFDKWNPRLAAKFRQAMLLDSARLILQPNNANLAPWMTTPAGKVFMNMRKFTFAAWRGKLLSELQQHDKIMAYKLAMTTTAAVLGYAATVYFQSLVVDDPQEYRDRMLSNKALASAAFSRSAWSSMMPLAIDTVISDIGPYDPLFSPANTTGRTGGVITGNTGSDWAIATANTVGALIFKPVSAEHKFSREDVQNALKAGFVPHVMGLYSAVDAIAKAAGLPKYSGKPKIVYE